MSTTSTHLLISASFEAGAEIELCERIISHFKGRHADSAAFGMLASSAWGVQLSVRTALEDLLSGVTVQVHTIIDSSIRWMSGDV